MSSKYKTKVIVKEAGFSASDYTSDKEAGMDAAYRPTIKISLVITGRVTVEDVARAVECVRTRLCDKFDEKETEVQA